MTQAELLEAELENARAELEGIEAGQVSGRLGRRARLLATIERLEGELEDLRRPYRVTDHITGESRIVSESESYDTIDRARRDTGRYTVEEADAVRYTSDTAQRSGPWARRSRD